MVTPRLPSIFIRFINRSLFRCLIFAQYFQGYPLFEPYPPGPHPPPPPKPPTPHPPKPPTPPKPPKPPVTKCTVSAWSAWSACSNGVETSTRTIITQGEHCPPLTRTKTCKSERITLSGNAELPEVSSYIT